MWRIKTFEEFNSKRPPEWNSQGKMDYLYGMILPQEEWEDCRLKKIIEIPTKNNYSFSYWIINSSHYVFDKSILEPNYEIY